jgi:DNA-directed RNA polymerase beta' subunit
LGQQAHFGLRQKYILNNEKRGLPHYPFENLDLHDEYESHGFVDSSFITGLSAKQYFFHAVSGREGCADTAKFMAKKSVFDT